MRSGTNHAVGIHIFLFDFILQVKDSVNEFVTTQTRACLPAPSAAHGEGYVGDGQRDDGSFATLHRVRSCNHRDTDLSPQSSNPDPWFRATRPLAVFLSQERSTLWACVDTDPPPAVRDQRMVAHTTRGSLDHSSPLFTTLKPTCTWSMVNTY